MASWILEHTAHRFSPFPKGFTTSVLSINLNTAGKLTCIKSGSKTIYQTDQGGFSIPRRAGQYYAFTFSDMQTNIGHTCFGASILKINMFKPDHFIPPNSKNRMVPAVHIPSQRKSAGCIPLA